MREEDFSSGKPGSLVSVGGVGKAFVPNPLPPTLDFGPRLIRALSEADRTLGELAGLEGTRASLVDLYAFEVEPPLFGERGSDVREVQNYVRALEHGLERLSELPISQRLFREMHA